MNPAPVRRRSIRRRRLRVRRLTSALPSILHATDGKPAALVIALLFQTVVDEARVAAVGAEVVFLRSRPPAAAFADAVEFVDEAAAGAWQRAKPEIIRAVAAFARFIAVRAAEITPPAR